MKVQLRSPEIFYNYYMALPNSTLNDLLCKESEMFYYYTRMHGSIQRSNVHDAPHVVPGDVHDLSAQSDFFLPLKIPADNGVSDLLLPQYNVKYTEMYIKVQCILHRPNSTVCRCL